MKDHEVGGEMAKWNKNKFSPISIKMLWDIDIGLIRQFPNFENNFNRKGTFWPFSCQKSGFWPIFAVI
jgi:hypothetical protein